MSDEWVLAHDARVRKCIVLSDIPVSELRDDIRCPACDELHRLMHLDPDVTEILSCEPWCDSCQAGDKPFIPADTTGDESND